MPMEKHASASFYPQTPNSQAVGTSSETHTRDGRTQGAHQQAIYATTIVRFATVEKKANRKSIVAYTVFLIRKRLSLHKRSC